MCGIAGYAGRSEDRVRPVLRDLVRGLAHRGPDDEGTRFCRLGDSFLGLGHRRLAILDLSPSGHQPMELPGISLVFNGEIWNYAHLRSRLMERGHRFVGTSDTEVLLHWLEEFGPDGIRDLEGMYALAWVNHDTQQLFLARDPFGIKPLYYVQNAEGFAFASEVRALLDSGLVERQVDSTGLATLLAFGAVQAPYTIVAGIREFPAGHWGCYDPNDGLRTNRFFRFPSVCPTTPSEAYEKLCALTDNAIVSHLMSDVPIGVLLSAGLDSRLIAAMASRHTQIRSFTLGFEEDREQSEVHEATAFARQHGLSSTEVWLSETDCLAATEEWLEDIDQPSVDGLNVYIICRAVKRAGIKVALSGLGGDELFGGYPSFADTPRLRRLVSGVRWLPRIGKTALAALLGARKGQIVREKLSDILIGPADLRRIYLQRRRLISDQALFRLGVRSENVGLEPDFQPLPLPEDCSQTDDEIYEISRLECGFYQSNMLLRDADANSMAHGLELRVPLLDQKLAEYALSLPGSIKLPAGKPNKHLLRRILGEQLGIDPGAAPKRGFSLPLARWLRGPLLDLAEKAIDRLKKSGLVAPHAVSQIWASFTREPQTPAWSRAFMLVVLGNYLERHRLDSVDHSVELCTTPA
jgi:asparagine synthase (glutamine-hydrolysing)